MPSPITASLRYQRGDLAPLKMPMRKRATPISIIPSARMKKSKRR